MGRSEPPDNGSPARLIATMVGIVGILLLGSLAWSAVGALFSALGQATSVFSASPATPTSVAEVVARPLGTPTSGTRAEATAGAQADAKAGAQADGTASARAEATAGVGVGATAGARAPATATPAPEGAVTPAPEPTVALTSGPTPPPVKATTPTPSGRAPWILLPQPAPGTRVAPGPLVVEARGRGDAPISAIRLELDGATLPVSLEQRDAATWRGAATANVPAGRHAVRAVVQDEQGRSGSYRWTFDAGP